MLARVVTNTLSNLAVALVVLFSVLQLWWAVESLLEVRRMEAAGNQSAASPLARSSDLRGATLQRQKERIETSFDRGPSTQLLRFTAEELR